MPLLITSVDFESKLGTSGRTDALTMKELALPPRIGPHGPSPCS